jgi:hypothetical protein
LCNDVVYHPFLVAVVFKVVGLLEERVHDLVGELEHSELVDRFRPPNISYCPHRVQLSLTRSLEFVRHFFGVSGSFKLFEAFKLS